MPSERRDAILSTQTSTPPRVSWIMSESSGPGGRLPSPNDTAPCPSHNRVATVTMRRVRDNQVLSNNRFLLIAVREELPGTIRRYGYGRTPVPSQTFKIRPFSIRQSRYFYVPMVPRAEGYFREKLIRVNPSR